MAGLIDTTMAENKTTAGPDAGTVTQADATGYDAERRTVDAAKETVSGQLDAMLKSGSPYLERARAGAAQTANSRGLLNSSMAAGAGEAAAIDAATPIANADANIYGTASRDNQAYGNKSLEFTAGAKNKSAGDAADAANVMAQQKLKGEQETGLQTLRGTQATALQTQQEEAQASQLATKGAQDVALQTLRGNQATGLANIEATYKGLLQSSSSAQQLFQTNTAAMLAINEDPNTTPEQKAAAMRTLGQTLEAGLKTIGDIANIDLTAHLDFSGGGGVRTADAGTAAATAAGATVAGAVSPDALSVAQKLPVASRASGVSTMVGITSAGGKSVIQQAISGTLGAGVALDKAFPDATERTAYASWMTDFQKRYNEALTASGKTGTYPATKLTATQAANVAVGLPYDAP